MKKTFWLSFIIIITFSSVILSKTWEDLEKKKDLDFTIHLEKEQYLVLEPIWVHCLIENNTSHSIPAHLPDKNDLLKVYIVNEVGDTVKYDHLIPPELIPPPGEEPLLEPGGYWYVCRDINYELEPGEYTVRILYPAYAGFYKKLFDEDEEHLKWKNFGEFGEEIGATGGVLSNTLRFRVVEPEKEEDIEAYQILQEARKNFKEKNTDLFYKKLIHLAENYPEHPYASFAYYSCQWYLRKMNDVDKINEFNEKLISTFPNTQYTYDKIHAEVLGMESSERKSYFRMMKIRYDNQWIVKYIDQLERRFERAEARGWGEDWDDKMFERMEGMKKHY